MLALYASHSKERRYWSCTSLANAQLCAQQPSSQRSGRSLLIMHVLQYCSNSGITVH